MATFQVHADLPPPASSTGALGWLRKNLFDSPANGAMTLLALYALYLTMPPLVDWALLKADWALGVTVGSSAHRSTVTPGPWAVHLQGVLETHVCCRLRAR